MTMGMLTVSSLPGLPGLPDLAPVKSGMSGGAGDFAPLIARLLGPAIAGDCISLPPGGGILPGSTPLSMPADIPSEPPAILVVLPDPDEPIALSSAMPAAATLAPPPPRFAPIIAPAAAAASPLAIDHAPAPTATDPIDEPRPPFAVTRTALLTSAAATVPLPTSAARPVTAPPSRVPVPTETIARLFVPGRKSATTKPVVDGEDAPLPAVVPVELSSGTVAIEVDAPVLRDAAATSATPVVVPPPVNDPVAPADASNPTGGAPTASRASVARPVTPDLALPTAPAARPPIAELATDDAAPPTGERSTQAPVTLSANPDRKPRTPIASTTPRGVEADRLVAIAPAVRAGFAATAVPPPASRPIVANASVAAPSVLPPVAPPLSPAVEESGRAIIPPPVDDRPAGVIPAVVDTPVQPAAVVESMSVDVMTPTRGRLRPDAPTPIKPLADVAVAPATPQTAAPVILPALQAFGAAIRRAMADEHKPAPSANDTVHGLTGLAGAAMPATGQTVAPGDTTLDTADRRWPHAMAEQIERLRDTADAQSTRIRLLPDALGPIDVAVRRDGEQVHVHFAAADAQTRQLLADAQPRLAEAAEARGLKLGRTDVSGGDLAGGDRQQHRSTAHNQAGPSRPSRSAPARATTADTDDARLA